jgi:hypothetical protein
LAEFTHRYHEYRFLHVMDLDIWDRTQLELKRSAIKLNNLRLLRVQQETQRKTLRSLSSSLKLSMEVAVPATSLEPFDFPEGKPRKVTAVLVWPERLLLLGA